jgi:hypothetical protein
VPASTGAAPESISASRVGWWLALGLGSVLSAPVMRPHRTMRSGRWAEIQARPRFGRRAPADIPPELRGAGAPDWPGDGACVARGRWNRALITEGIALITETLAHARVGQFQIQAAIAAVHAEATDPAETDWTQILALYDLLAGSSANPMVLLNRAVAAAMVHGPRAGLDMLADLDRDRRLSCHHRLHAVRAHLLEQTGDHTAAQAAFEEAARRATNIPEQRYLLAQTARLAANNPD